MLEEGIVVEVRNSGKAFVELERKSSCGVCSACSISSSGKMNIEADNPIGAKPGNRVKIDIKAKGLVLGIIAIYLLPALGLIFGIIFGSKISEEFSLGMNPDNFGMLLGVILMFLFFIIARYYGRRRILYSAEIVEIK